MPESADATICPALDSGFALPDRDLGQVLEALGIKLFVRERSLAQYISWSVQTGLIAFLDSHGPATMDEITFQTALTEAGADSLLGVLCALGFVRRTGPAGFELQPTARSYLSRRSPYCITDQIECIGFPMPRPYLRGRATFITALKLRLLGLSPSIRYGALNRLRNQHARNLGACAVAVRTGEFSHVDTMLDIAGGTGTFSIPLALDYPKVQVILTDLPEALHGARSFISASGLDGRIRLHGLNALQRPWDIPACDGMFIGNFLHGFDDVTCLNVLREAFCRLPAGGTVWIHEMLWHETRDGPLITALWHAAMRSAGPGRQRTGGELSLLLESAGFSRIRTVPTSGAYALVIGQKTSAPRTAA